MGRMASFEPENSKHRFHVENAGGRLAGLPAVEAVDMHAALPGHLLEDSEERSRASKKARVTADAVRGSRLGAGIVVDS